MSPQTAGGASEAVAVPPIVDQATWEAALAELRVREKAATRELDAIAAARRRLPMVELPEYILDSADGPARLADVFEGKRQLVVYHHMWFPGEEWQCPGCTGFTSEFTRLEFLDSYDARFVVVTQGPINEALAYRAQVGNKMTWYSTANSPFGADMGAPIVDNLSAHFTPKVEAFLDDHPRIFLHNTPTHASWLNQVELFFSILERRLLRNGEFDSVEALGERIIAFINDYNRRAKPFRWTYDGRPLKVA